MDADGDIGPEALRPFLALMEMYQPDLVLGSRYVANGRIVNWPLRRRLLSRFANAYIRAVTRLAAHDCTSGYRCWRHDAIASLPLDTFASDGYSFLVEMLYAASTAGSMPSCHRPCRNRRSCGAKQR